MPTFYGGNNSSAHPPACQTSIPIIRIRYIMEYIYLIAETKTYSQLLRARRNGSPGPPRAITAYRGQRPARGGYFPEGLDPAAQE
jgi:hypothetical protein